MKEATINKAGSESLFTLETSPVGTCLTVTRVCGTEITSIAAEVQLIIEMKIELETHPVSNARLMLSIGQAIFALASLVCLGSLSSTQCWHHEPSERGYLWWLTPSTVLVAVGDWFLEAFRADYLIRTAVDAVSTIFWIGGIGAAGQLQKLTTRLDNCNSNNGVFPETGAMIAFAVFEVLLFGTAAYRAREDLIESEDQDSRCENGRAPNTANGTHVAMSHLQPGDFSEYITVNVGSEDHQRAIQVAKAPICRRSSYVKTAVSDSWTARLGIPSKTKVVDLSDDDPDVFQTYVRCIMENIVAVPNLDIEHPRREQSDAVFSSLFALYVLADKLGDPESMNSVVDAIARYSLASHRVPDCDGIAYAFEYSVKTSPLRRLIADLFYLGYHQEGTK